MDMRVKSNYKLHKNDIINVILPEPIELNVNAEKIAYKYYL